MERKKLESTLLKEIVDMREPNRSLVGTEKSLLLSGDTESSGDYDKCRTAFLLVKNDYALQWGHQQVSGLETPTLLSILVRS